MQVNTHKKEEGDANSNISIHKNNQIHTCTHTMAPTQLHTHKQTQIHRQTEERHIVVQREENKEKRKGREKMLMV